MVVMNRQQTCRGSFIDRKNANFLARINNFAHDSDGHSTIPIIPGINMSPQVSTVFPGSSVGLPWIPFREGHRKSRTLPNIGTFCRKVICPEPNVFISGL